MRRFFTVLLAAALTLPLAACERTENSSENASQASSKTSNATSSALQSAPVGEENRNTPSPSVRAGLKELTSTVEITVYYTLDRTDKEYKEIFRHGLKEACFEFIDKNYIFFNSGDTIKIDLENGENTGFSLTDGYTAFGSLGGKLVCRSADDSDNAVYYVDIANGEITRSELRSPEDSRYGIGASIAAVGSDSALIRTEQRAIPNNHGGTAGYYYEYAILPLGNLFNGIPNYEPIKTINGR